MAEKPVFVAAHLCGVQLGIKRRVPEEQSLDKEGDEAHDNKSDSNPNSTLEFKGKEKVDNSPKRVSRLKRPSFSISLTMQEIDEDFIGFTGSRPPRRPRKWSKNLKKHLDKLFPGVSLESAN